MKVKLKDIGRGKVNKEIEVKNIYEAEKECKKYLASSIVELMPVGDDNMLFAVIVGGLRHVGEVEVLSLS
jgi:hypothetical protein